MNDSPKFTDTQYRLIGSVIAVIIFSLMTAAFFQIPEKYHSYYALLLSVIFLVDIALVPTLKKQKMSKDERLAYPLFIIMGLGLFLTSSVLIYLNLQPKSWMFSFISASSFLTGLVIFQYLRDRNII